MIFFLIYCKSVHCRDTHHIGAVEPSLVILLSLTQKQWKPKKYEKINNQDKKCSRNQFEERTRRFSSSTQSVFEFWMAVQIDKQSGRIISKVKKFFFMRLFSFWPDKLFAYLFCCFMSRPLKKRVGNKRKKKNPSISPQKNILKSREQITSGHS